ncbi:MAG: cation transporter [Bacteroidales bacterium]|jgi:divalent metal cation (Fe/Co/Zn/Cd) transporter|nr:cation transporter [Bacteroidales bacterium]
MKNNQRLYTYAIWLAVFTILFNLAEGIISIYFGIREDSLTLAGFGADSFIETISASGVLWMIYRIRRNTDSSPSIFEKTTLRITSICFFILCLLLAVGIGNSIVNKTQPESTLPGLIISLISIASMIFLIKAKKSIGKKLNSDAIRADANCNLVCVYMSIVLLLSSLLYELWAIPWIDIAGTLGIIWFSFKEGREAWQKSTNPTACSCHSCEN